MPNGPASHGSERSPSPRPPLGSRFFDAVEWLGNKLPEPAVLFAILAAVVILLSGFGSALGWRVQPKQVRVELIAQVDAAGAPLLLAGGQPKMTPRLDQHGKPVTTLVDIGSPIAPRSLMTTDGVYWMLSSMVRNFVTLPALGLVVVCMLGIGLAEKVGFFGAFMRILALATPRTLLTPMVVFLGANSSVAADAGFVILPPLAAALYLAVRRHPVAGLAAAFAGVAGGFGGGFFPNAADGFLAGVASQAAGIIDPDYHDVVTTHNQYFKMGSAIIITLVGWFITDRIVEPRLLRHAAAAASTSANTPVRNLTPVDMAITSTERRGLIGAGLAFVVVVALFIAMTLLPGWPLAGKGLPTLADGRVLVQQNAQTLSPEQAALAPAGTLLAEAPLPVGPGPGKPRLLENTSDRWTQAIVPLILFAFLIPGIVYGRLTGSLRTQKDFVEAVYHGIASIIPVIAIAFFLGQFVNYFSYSGLDRMLAFAGGDLLMRADLPTPVLLVLFILIVVAGDFAISGMLSKFALLAPIFIPMFMMVGLSPELTTAAYRIGDSVVNTITPMNSYLLIILAVLQKYRKDAGLGTLIALMLPYSISFFLCWTTFLLVWLAFGWPLGTNAPLQYLPAH